MTIGWPQAIMLALILVGMGSSLAKYGKPKTDSYDLIDVLVGPSLILGLLFWGGFFGRS